MTFREFLVYYEQQNERMKDEAKLQERFTARICSLLANIHRDSKKRMKPFKEEDFMSGQKKKGLSTEQFATVLRTITIANGGEIVG